MRLELGRACSSSLQPEWDIDRVPLGRRRITVLSKHVQYVLRKSDSLASLSGHSYRLPSGICEMRFGCANAGSPQFWQRLDSLVKFVYTNYYAEVSSSRPGLTYARSP